ncbi:MAG: DUF1801 domain-containing protein [Anaerolineales bacterium]|nr:DUF1801 domain-containing protein [Anaerolineales bacterium]
MKSAQKPSKEIDAYIKAYPKEVQIVLGKVRAVIRKAAPDAQEALKYGIPTFILNGNLVHFGGFAHHIGFYPTPSGTSTFKKELAPYAGAKGSIRFPLDKPIPYGLIAKIVKFRVKENRAKADSKTKRSVR